MRMENMPPEQAQILADRLVLIANHAMWDSKKLSPFGRASFVLTPLVITKYYTLSGHEKTRS